MLTTRIEPIDRDIAVIVAQDLSPEARSAALAAFAREELAKAQEINAAALGRVPPYETVVDGGRGRSPESVRPDGVIVFEFTLIEEALRWIGEQLVENSPVLIGTYAKSHVLFADGEEVAPGAAIPAATEYVFVNMQPYARKIERGLSDQAPDGVYQAVAALAQHRFGNVARVRFSFRSPPGGAIDRWAASTRLASSSRGRRGSRSRADWWLRWQPSIAVTPK